jgi:hypothetical protein
MWRSSLKIVAMKNKTIYSVCVAEQHTNVNYVQILRVSQQKMYGKCMYVAGNNNIYVQ